MTCRICGNRENNPEFVVRETMYGTGEEFAYFECSRCECLQIASVPADSERYYPDDYYAYGARSSTPTLIRRLARRLRNRLLLRADVVGRAVHRAHRVRPHGPLRALGALRLRKDSRILDVGCGDGALVRDLYDMGFRGVCGIDPRGAGRARRAGVPSILKQTVHEVGGTWDVVMFHHSFEHLADPLPALQAVHHLLTPDGVALIRAPLVPCEAWERYGVNWVQIDAPRHLYLHSVRSIRLLAARSGLSLERVVYDSEAFQFWGSEQCAHGVALRSRRSYAVNPRASMFSRRQIADYAERARRLNRANRGDQAAFYLRRSSRSS